MPAWKGFRGHLLLAGAAWNREQAAKLRAYPSGSPEEQADTERIALKFESRAAQYEAWDATEENAS